MHGALLIDKPAGMSSFAVLSRLQRALRQHLGCTRRELPKMGHGGTLDPFATGLLIVCVGQAVKLSRYFLGARKEYSGEIIFGTKTDSADLTGAVIAETATHPKDRAEVVSAAQSFLGRSYLQTPPMYSAKKVDGQPLYKAARRGETVERKAEERTIYSFDIHEYQSPIAKFNVSCSTGTYIRTLAEDLAVRMDSLAHLQSLRREAVASFLLCDAISLDDVCASSPAEWETLSCWVPMHKLLVDMPSLCVNAESARAIIQGQKATIDALSPQFDVSSSVNALYHAEQLVATVRRQENGVWRIERVFQTL